MANPLLDALLADREGNSASGFSPMSAPTPAAGARMIDFDTPLPEMTPDAATSEDTLAFPEEDQTYTPLDAPEPAETSAEIAPAPRANPLLAALQADQAATQQAVAEATTPDDRLPVIRPELADALGVLDYRDPQEGQRRQQAAAVGEILNLPMFERVNLGAAPVNADGTVTIRRAQAVSPEAQAAADEQMEIIRRNAAAEMNPPNRAVEAFNRAERGARLGVEDVRSGFYSIVEDFFRPQQNPYLEKSQTAAIEDVPKLESRLADLQSRQAAFTKGDLGPNRDRISPFDDEISALQNQLAKARQATTGEPVTENFLGSLSRASGDLSDEARQNQQAIAADYTPAQIRPERDKEFWMTVADSLGRSAPTTAGAILNPFLGLTLGYTQVFSNAESEFEQAAAQTGKPIDPEARAEYAHSQALLQTPFELVGDLALAKVARDSVAASGKALMQAVRVGDSGAVTSFVSNLPRRAGQLAAAAAGETLITTPAQTVIEQKLAESEGVRAPISNAELAARTGQAMQVAGAQSLLLGGGPVALETGVTTIADGIAARRQAPTTPPPAAAAEVPQNFTPISSPAPAPGPVAPAPAPQNLGQVRAPEIPIDQAALDEAFGSPFAPPQPAPADSFAPSPLSETTPTTFAAPSSAISVPESTGSSELIAGEGSSSSQPVSSKAPKPNAATPPDNADFGPAFPEFTGNPIGAFAKLEETKTGEVPAALNHPTIGAVDVIWGQEGKTKASGFGLSKILKHHPEARPILENLFDAFDVKSENENTIQLELGDYSAVLRKNWKGQEKRWLLTSFGRNSAADGRTIDIPAPVSKSGDDTAPTKSGKQNKQPLKTNVNRFKSEAGYIDMGAVQDFGNSIYAAGVSFSKWAGQMLAKFGESISSALKSIWAAVSGQNYLPQAREQGSVAVPSRAKTNLPGLASNQFSLDSRVETPTNPIMPEEQRAAETSGQPSRGGSDAEDYRGQHKAPNFESAPAFDLTGNEVYPKDVYSRPDWYEQDNGLEEMRKIQRFQGNPEAPVWIHRAVPKNIYDNAMVEGERSGVSPLSLLIKEGDWVTTNKQYAKDHGEGALNGEFKVVSKRVKARDIFTNGDSIFEWGYYPSNPDSPAPSTGAVETTGLSTNPATPRNRKGEAGSVILPSREDLIQAGQNLYEAGMEFTDWASRMVQQFGEAVRDILAEIWKAVSGQNYLPQARERGSVNISPSTGPKPRKFTQSVQAAPGVASEVKAQLTALDYDPISNAQTLASARARIDAAGSMDSAVTQFMGNAANPDFQPTAVDYATGIELLGQLQSRGRHEDAAAIADFMARAGTTQGQAIQALSLISRLTPAGIEAFAARQITRAARNDPKIEELIQDNQRLRAEIAAAKRDSATAAIVDNRAAIKAALPAGADPVATNIAIREAILQSPTPLAAQAATAQILQDNGLSERAAIRIAQSITKDFLKTTTDSRAKVLQDLLALAEKDRRFNKSKIGSLIRLNREGKLTDSRLHADMAKMLGIPAWTPEHSAKVQDLLRQREAATDPRIKLVKAAEALDVIYRESMPAGMLAKIDTFQTLMMLLNPKTWIRNIGGNAFMFGADLAADSVAWGADAAVSIVTGNRTRTGLDLGTRFSELGAGLGDIQAGYEFARTQGMGRLGSFKEGVQTLIRLGRLYSSKKYDSAEITGFTGTTFQSGIGKVLEDTLGAALSLVDRGFYQSAFRASLDNQMRLAAQDGPPLAAPTPDMIAQARMDASRAVYQDENAASRTLSGLRRVLNANQRWGLGSMLMKFTQVPGSILMRGIEFSPLGFIRNAYQLLAPALSNRVAFDQKAFTEQFSRALVGTTGLVATGYWLAQLGIISAGRENEDEKKRNLAKAEGWGSYKLNVSALKRALITGNFWTRQPRQDGDVVVNYDWAQPLSISVAMGAYAKENQKAVQEDILRGKKQSLLATGFNWMSAAAASATGAMNALVEQPLLSGLSTFFRNAAYDDIPGAILAAASDVPKSMMPTAARQWMQLDDNIVRETRDSSPFRQYVNELKSQLPGLSQTLPAKRDILGEDVERYQRHSNTVFNVLFNPSMVTYIKKSPLLAEMSQVYEMTGNPSVIPNQAGRDFTIEGVKVRLTTEEISALQKDMGALSVAAVEKFVLDDPRYDKATWDIKAKAFTRALEKAATAAKYRILLSRPDLKQRAKIEHQQTLQRRQEMQQMMDSGVGAALMQ